jgi:hypothetical protein
VKNKLIVLFVMFVLVVSAIGAIRTQAHKLVYDPLTLPIAANLGARPDGIAEYTVATPSKSSNYVDCADTGGCDLFIGEQNVRNGQVFRTCNVSANAVLVREAAGVLEMAGNWTAGQWDCIEYQYVNDRFVEQFRVNN